MHFNLALSPTFCKAKKKKKNILTFASFTHTFLISRRANIKCCFSEFEIFDIKYHTSNKNKKMNKKKDKKIKKKDKNKKII